MVGGDTGGAGQTRFHHRISPAANPGGPSSIHREPAASGLASLGAAVTAKSQSGQPREALVLRSRFDQNAIPLDEEF